MIDIPQSLNKYILYCGNIFESNICVIKLFVLHLLINNFVYEGSKGGFVKFCKASGGGFHGIGHHYDSSFL